MLVKCGSCNRQIDTARDAHATRLCDPDTIYCSGVCANVASEKVFAALAKIDAKIDAHGCDKGPESCPVCAELWTERADANV